MTLRRPKLLFSPLAWLKLQYFCHRGDTEIGGFGVSPPGQPLYIEEFVTVRQDTSPVTVSFRDDAVADYFDRCADRKLAPERFARIWLHTHPGASVTPSTTDEETFERVFGHCDWAVMAILGRTGRTYARLCYSRGPGIDLELSTGIDWAEWPSHLIMGPSMEEQMRRWATEYEANVNVAPIVSHSPPLDFEMVDEWPWREEWWDDNQLFDDSGVTNERIAVYS